MCSATLFVAHAKAIKLEVPEFCYGLIVRLYLTITCAEVAPAQMANSIYPETESYAPALQLGKLDRLDDRREEYSCATNIWRK